MDLYIKIDELRFNKLVSDLSIDISDIKKYSFKESVIFPVEDICKIKTDNYKILIVFILFIHEIAEILPEHAFFNEITDIVPEYYFYNEIVCLMDIMLTEYPLIEHDQIYNKCVTMIKQPVEDEPVLFLTSTEKTALQFLITSNIMDNRFTEYQLAVLRKYAK